MFRTMAGSGGGEVFDLEGQPEGAELTIDDAETSDEVETVKVSVDPGKPSERQVAEHRLTHLPYRLWCRFSVEAAASSTEHAQDR